MAATLSALVLAGVMSAFLFIVRTGYRASSYSQTEAELRRGLETFARDARQALDVHWTSAQSLTFTLPDATTPQVTYAYDATAGSATYRCFYREAVAGGTAQPRQVLVRNLAPDFAFLRYKLGTPDAAEAVLAANDLETKQIQLVLRALGDTPAAAPAATQAAFSARYVLRNKRVSN